MPTFKAIDSPRDGEGVSLKFSMLGRQGGVSAVVEVVMVIMTFRQGPTGLARSLSTGK